MNKMIIDVEYLKKLSRELEINKSTRLLSVRRSIEDGLRLDSKIRSKLSRQNMLLENLNDIIYTNRMLHESVEKAIMGFSPLECLKSDVQIEDFILLTNTAPDAQTSLLNMFGDQVNTLEGINSLIEQMAANINTMTSKDTWYEFQASDTLLTYAKELGENFNQFEYDEYNNTIKITGFLLSQVADKIRIEQQRLQSLLDSFNECIVEDETMNIIKFSDQFSDYEYIAKTDKNGYVDFEQLIKDLNIETEISKLTDEVEKLSLYVDNLNRFKNNITIFQSMVYNVKIAQKLKPFEDVISNSDFDKLSTYD